MATKEEAIHRAFARVDADGSGQLDAEEVLQAVEGACAALRCAAHGMCYGVLCCAAGAGAVVLGWFHSDMVICSSFMVLFTS